MCQLTECCPTDWRLFNPAARSLFILIMPRHSDDAVSIPPVLSSIENHFQGSDPWQLKSLLSSVLVELIPDCLAWGPTPLQAEALYVFVLDADMERPLDDVDTSESTQEKRSGCKEKSEACKCLHAIFITLSFFVFSDHVSFKPIIFFCLFYTFLL